MMNEIRWNVEEYPEINKICEWMWSEGKEHPPPSRPAARRRWQNNTTTVAPLLAHLASHLTISDELTMQKHLPSVIFILTIFSIQIICLPAFSPRFIRQWWAQKKDVSKTTLHIGFRENEFSNQCRIKVIGVGGGGSNAVNRMVESSIDVATSIDFWVINTDAQALSRCAAPNKINIGIELSRY